MKKVLSVVFILGIIAGFLIGSVAVAAISFAGLALTQSPHKLTGYAFLQIVPGKYVVPVPVDGVTQEVPYMSRAEKSLYDQLITLNRANPVTQTIISQGGISFDPISYYIRYNITGASGRQKILGQSTIQIEGVTNFPNGATLPQFYNFCFDRVAVRYATTNTAANTAVQAIAGWSSVRGSMPAALGNGHFLLSSNKNTIVETPISDFTSVAAITGGGERDYDGGVLEKPRFMLELINVELEIVYAAGQSIPAEANTTYAVEVMFYGVQARLKA